MSADSPPPEPIAIPESLRAQLAEFRRHLWRIKVLEAIIAGIIGLVLSFLLVYGLDRLWQTPGWARLILLLGGTSLFAIFAPLWIHRWVWRHRRETQLARLIARRFPGLGDRLLGVIELQSQDEHASSLSPRLRAAAMEAVAAEVESRKLDDALPPGRHAKWAIAAVALIGLAVSVFTLTPRAGSNALKRWLMPLSNTPRYTFTVLESPPVEMVVPFGESFQVNLHLSSETEQRPANASGRYGLQPAVQTQLDGDHYLFEFPGQQDPGTITFNIGDARHEVRVRPMQRPVMEAVTAQLKYPDYLKIPEKTLNLESGSLNAVEGSQITFSLRSERELKQAEFGPASRIETNAQPTPEEPKAEDSTAPPVSQASSLKIEGRTALTPPVTIGAQSFELPFTWTDIYGLQSASGYKLRIEPLKDAPPVTYLQGTDRIKAILPEETIDLEVLAEDDFGLSIAGIEWTGEPTRPTDEKPAQGGMKLFNGNAEQRRFSGPVAFSPGAFGITPQKLTLRAYTEDYFPNRARVYSEPIVLYVLTRDEHAQLMKNQFDRAISELEDLARRERNLLEENQRLEKLNPEELQTPENLEKLHNQRDAEAENTQRMEELSQRMEQLMKDSARNGEIDKQTLKKMAESLKDMKDLSSKDMPKVESKLNEAGENTNTPEQAKKDTEDAVKEQQKVVEKMQKAIEKANDANRRFEEGTFVNRLKKASSDEDGIVRSIRARAEMMFGLKIGDPEFDPADLRRLKEGAHQQSLTASDVRWIQEDLGNYFTRTEKPIFKEILDDMRNSKIDLKLDEIRRLIEANQPSSSTEAAATWAKKLAEWAKKLEGEMQSGGGGGDGGGQNNSEDEDFEFMLRVMKMIQTQQDLRAQTRALEQLRRTTTENQP